MLTSLSHFFKTTGSFSSDLILLAVLFFLFFAVGMYFGKSRLVSLILAFYPARFLYENFPLMSHFLVLHGPQLVVINKILIFLFFFVLVDIMISRYIFSESIGSSSHFVQVGALALSATVLLLVFSYSIISLDIFYNFSVSIDKLFVVTNLFWWTLAPLLLLLII